MKFFLTLSLISAFIVAGFILMGVSLDENVVVEESIVVEAPPAVVWNELTSFGQHHKWQKTIEALYNYNNSARQIRYNFDRKTIMANQQVRIRENAQTIDFIKIGAEEYSELQDIGGSMRTVALADGNTEVHWQITYTIPQISLKMINRFSLEEKIHKLLKKNLLSFKNYMES
ncbi:MAG: SRPBCC family protein [Calditrichae bacterium]|nr:SRPBCC family protein [Calditrichota bacterium]MCB9057414.1 SRPBCC family protein [Calditrichia bacterium]